MAGPGDPYWEAAERAGIADEFSAFHHIRELCPNLVGREDDLANLLRILHHSGRLAIDPDAHGEELAPFLDTMIRLAARGDWRPATW